MAYYGAPLSTGVTYGAPTMLGSVPMANTAPMVTELSANAPVATEIIAAPPASLVTEVIAAPRYGVGTEYITSAPVVSEYIAPAPVTTQYVAPAPVVPKIHVAELLKQVIVTEYQYVEKFVEVPQVVYEERIIEVPTIQRKEVIKQITKTQLQVIEKRVLKKIVQYVEKGMEVPQVIYEERAIEAPQVLMTEAITKKPQAAVQKVQKRTGVVEYLAPIVYADGNFWDGIRKALGRDEVPEDVIETSTGKTMTMDQMSEYAGDELRSLFPIFVKAKAAELDNHSGSRTSSTRNTSSTSARDHAAYLGLMASSALGDIPSLFFTLPQLNFGFEENHQVAPTTAGVVIEPGEACVNLYKKLALIGEAEGLGRTPPVVASVRFDDEAQRGTMESRVSPWLQVPKLAAAIGMLSGGGLGGLCVGGLCGSAVTDAMTDLHFSSQEHQPVANGFYRTIGSPIGKASYRHGFYIYYPSIYEKNLCEKQKDGQWCCGKCSIGTPSDYSCWAHSFRYHLEGIAGRRGDPRGLMLQTVEQDGKLGPGQQEEEQIARDLEIPIFRCQGRMGISHKICDWDLTRVF